MSTSTPPTDTKMPPISVLVLGNSDFAEMVAQSVYNLGADVTIATSKPAELKGIQHVYVDPSSHTSIMGAFTQAIKVYGTIDSVLSAFVPPAMTTAWPPGLDQTALNEGLTPHIHVTKAALYHYRRMPLQGKRIAYATAGRNGPDVMARTTAQAVLGFFRSMFPRFQQLNAQCELVYADEPSQAAAHALASAAMRIRQIGGPVPGNPPHGTGPAAAVLRVVEGDNVKVLGPLHGAPVKYQFEDLLGRMRIIIKVQEVVARMRISVWKVEFGSVMFVALFVAVMAVMVPAGILGN